MKFLSTYLKSLRLNSEEHDDLDHKPSWSTNRKVNCSKQGVFYESYQFRIFRFIFIFSGTC